MRLWQRLRRWLRWRKFPEPDYSWAHEYGTGEVVFRLDNAKGFISGKYVIREEEGS